MQVCGSRIESARLPAIALSYLAQSDGKSASFMMSVAIFFLDILRFVERLWRDHKNIVTFQI